MFKGNKTFKKAVDMKPGSHRSTLMKNANKTLGVSKKLAESVKLPKGENQYEWWTAHLIDFYNKLNLIIGPVEMEIANKFKGKTMKVGQWDFYYQDKESKKYKNPQKLSAMDYLSFTIEYLERKISDTKLFPEDGKFPKNIKKVCSDLFKRMFRVFAFLVVENSKIFEKKGMVNHVNTVVKHFMMFVFEFKFLTRDRLQPIKEWVEVNMPKYKKKVTKKEK